NWDEVENSVRHHLVSRYLLEHYEPSKWVMDTLLLEPRDSETGKRPTPEKLLEMYRPLPPCDWGWILAHWSEGAGGGTPSALSATIAVPDEWRSTGATLELELTAPNAQKVRIAFPSGNMRWQ